MSRITLVLFYSSELHCVHCVSVPTENYIVIPCTDNYIVIPLYKKMPYDSILKIIALGFPCTKDSLVTPWTVGSVGQRASEPVSQWFTWSVGSVDQWVSGSVDQRADCFETFIFVNDVVKASFTNATLKSVGSVASVGQWVNGSMGQWLSGISGFTDPLAHLPIGPSTFRSSCSSTRNYILIPLYKDFHWD